MQEITKSSVAYAITMDDLIAFHLFHNDNSLAIHKIQRLNFIFSSLFTFLIGFCLFFTHRMPFWLALCVASLAVVAHAAYIRYYPINGFKKRLKKMVQNLHSDNKNPGVLGEHTLEVDEEGFTHITDYCRARYAWGGLARIETEPGYTYLYTGSHNAIVIPHHAISTGDLRIVLAQIGRHYQPDQKIALQVTASLVS